jgi:PhnB protein
MPKRSLSEQLDQHVDAIFAHRDAAIPPADPGIAPLLRIAADLRDLPRREFRANLKTDLQRRGSMATKASAVPVSGPEEKAAKTDQPVREGFRTITPYIVTNEPDELVTFMKQVFGAEERFRAVGSAGGYHIEVKLGDSMLMIGGGREWRGKPMPTAIHVYVEDADAAYHRAIEAGANSIHPPVDQPYGDREGSVRDLSGNDWYIGTHQSGHYIPEGLTNLQPYLHPKGAAQMIDFFVRAFRAEELGRHQTPDGTIHHTTVRIGSSTLEMGEAHGEFQPRPAMFYMHVPDVDEFYKRAVAAGAVASGPPTDQPYGARVGSVKDPMGNDWYISTPIKGFKG